MKYKRIPNWKKLGFRSYAEMIRNRSQLPKLFPLVVYDLDT